MSTGDKYITAHANADAALVIARLTAENARMRSTLDKIASGYLSVSSECLWCMRTIGTHANDCASVLARRALADTGEGRGEGWIVRKQQEPPRGVPLLGFFGTSNQAEAWAVFIWNGIDHHDTDDRDCVYCWPLAWRPLPAPPRTDDEKEGR